MCEDGKFNGSNSFLKELKLRLKCQLFLEIHKNMFLSRCLLLSDTLCLTLEKF